MHLTFIIKSAYKNIDLCFAKFVQHAFNQTLIEWLQVHTQSFEKAFTIILGFHLLLKKKLVQKHTKDFLRSFLHLATIYDKVHLSNPAKTSHQGAPRKHKVLSISVNWFEYTNSNISIQKSKANIARMDQRVIFLFTADNGWDSHMWWSWCFWKSLKKTPNSWIVMQSAWEIRNRWRWSLISHAKADKRMKNLFYWMVLFW